MARFLNLQYISIKLLITYSTLFYLHCCLSHLLQLQLRLASRVLLLNLLILLYLHYQLHASARKVEYQIPQVHIDYPGEVVPVEGLGVVHEEE